MEKKPSKKPTKKTVKKPAKKIVKKPTTKTQEQKPPNMSDDAWAVRLKHLRFFEKHQKKAEAAGDDPEARKNLPWGISYPVWDHVAKKEVKQRTISKEEVKACKKQFSLGFFLRDHWIRYAQEIESKRQRLVFDFYLDATPGIVKANLEKDWPSIIHRVTDIQARLKDKIPIPPKPLPEDMQIRLLIVEHYEQYIIEKCETSFAEYMLGMLAPNLQPLGERRKRTPLQVIKQECPGACSKVSPEDDPLDLNLDQDIWAKELGGHLWGRGIIGKTKVLKKIGEIFNCGDATARGLLQHGEDGLEILNNEEAGGAVPYNPFYSPTKRGRKPK